MGFPVLTSHTSSRPSSWEVTSVRRSGVNASRRTAAGLPPVKRRTLAGEQVEHADLAARGAEREQASIGADAPGGIAHGPAAQALSVDHHRLVLLLAGHHQAP